MIEKINQRDITRYNLDFKNHGNSHATRGHGDLAHDPMLSGHSLDRLVSSIIGRREVEGRTISDFEIRPVWRLWDAQGIRTSLGKGHYGRTGATPFKSFPKAPARDNFLFYDTLPLFKKFGPSVTVNINVERVIENEVGLNGINK